MKPQHQDPAGQPPTTLAPRRRLSAAYALAGILLLTCAIYVPSLTNELTNWDDDKYVTANAAIQSLSLHDIAGHFARFVQGNYHPLTMLSLSVDYALGGLNPVVYHATNLVLHLVSTALVFVLIRVLVPELQVAAVCALLFGIHPMHVESVAWVAERKDVLYGLFFLSSLVAYVRYAKTARSKYYWLAFALFILSVLSKAMAVSLTVTIVAVDVFLGRAFSRRLVLEKIPFVLVSVVFGLVAVAAQRAQGAVADALLPFYERIAIASYGLLQYLAMLVLPFDQSTFYPYPVLPTGHLPASYWLYPLGVVLLAAATWLVRKRSPRTVFGLTFFVLNVALVLQLFSVGSAIMADRYVYIASIGVFLIAGTAYVQLTTTRYGRWAAVGLAAYAVSLCVGTYRYSKVWKDSLTLWTHVISRDPQSSLPYYNRGSLLVWMQQYERGISDLSKAIEFQPRYAQAYHNRGAAKKALKDYEGAISDFSRAIEIDPGYKDAYLNLGNTLVSAGDLPDADRVYTQLIAIEDDRGRLRDVYVKRGITRYGMKQAADACGDWRKAADGGYPNAETLIAEYCKP